MRKFSALFNNSVVAFILVFFYLLSLQLQHPFRGQKANWLYQERKFKGTFAPGNYCSREHLFPGAKVPGNFRSWERRFPLGTFAPLSENTRERKVLIPRIVTRPNCLKPIPRLRPSIPRPRLRHLSICPRRDPRPFWDWGQDRDVHGSLDQAQDLRWHLAEFALLKVESYFTFVM